MALKLIAASIMPQPHGDSLRLEFDDEGDSFWAELDHEWKLGLRCHNAMYLCWPSDPLADYYPPLTLVVEGRPFSFGRGFTQDPVVLAVFRDYWYGPPHRGQFVVPRADDPYVTAKRTENDDDVTYDKAERALRAAHGRPND